MTTPSSPPANPQGNPQGSPPANPQSRAIGFVIIALIYIIAVVIGFSIFRALGASPLLWRVLAADLGATVFVYLTGVVFANASVYDPYWSVAPIVILLGLSSLMGQVSAAVLLLLIAVCYWGIRLTGNWAVTFKGLGSEDWRYVMYRDPTRVSFSLSTFLASISFPH